MSNAVLNSITTGKPTHSEGAYPWLADLGDGRYRNPILYADYSDPDVVRHGDDFYMVASSFNCTPGLPVWHSRDLVHWSLIANAVKNLPNARYTEVQPGCGIWAPSIRHHDGKFWIFFPMPDEGIFLTTATHPAGPWSEPHLVQAGRGLIDPCPLWDDDGHAYLVHAYAGSRAGIKHRLRVCPMAPDGSRLLGEGQIVFHEPERHPTLEGPKFLKRDGWYYLLAPAGGVATGWQLALRSRNIYGPYEEKIVLAQGRTPINGPHQGALVDTPRGEWWFIHFQDVGLYGRILHLQPVRWQDGWPLMGNPGADGIGEPVLTHAKPNLLASVADQAPAHEFTSSKLGLHWQWNANHEDHWHSLIARPGWLRLYAQPAAAKGWDHSPNLLLQKFPARAFAVETRLELDARGDSQEAGLAISGRQSAAIALVKRGHEHHIIFRHQGATTFLAKAPAPSIQFRIQVADGGECTFAYAFVESEFNAVKETFVAQPGVWIGAKVGLYSICSPDATGGHADFDYFRFSAD